MRQLILSALLILWPLTALPEPQDVTVTAVHDGDTYRVKSGAGEFKVRLFATDCPELKQADGASAQKYAENLLLNQAVRLDVKTKDLYGRTVADVLIRDSRLSQLLISGGYCWFYAQYSSDKALRAAQEEAKASKRGIWRGMPTPPWAWRKAQKTSVKTASSAASK